MLTANIHIIWGEVATSFYRRGIIDNTVRLAHAVYTFNSPSESRSFLMGISEARKPHEWALVTKLPDQRALGMPLRARLIEAIFLGDVDTIEQMLNTGVHPDTKDVTGLTALQLAAQQGQFKAAECLLKHGAQAQIDNDPSSHHSALSLAASSPIHGACRVAELLIQHQVDLERPNPQGKTALMLAIDQGRLDTAQLLIDNGAKLSTCDNNGQTARDHFDKKFGNVQSDAQIDKFLTTMERAEANEIRASQALATTNRSSFPTPYSTRPDGR